MTAVPSAVEAGVGGDRSIDQHRVDAISSWFDQHARDLPWRHRRTGYTGLVSEAMLQQTQVDRVVEAYAAFMDRFPTVSALARADEQDVLAMWNGLGYYRRARHLHMAAQRIVNEHNGSVPNDAAALRTLPGVGRYTAGAIASLIFGQREALVDGNVQRVIARWDGDERPPDDRGAVKQTWGRASELVQRAADPASFNEGMMELGARICKPRSPRCDECPVARGCRARELGKTDVIPPPKRPPRRTVMHFTTVVFVRRSTVLLERRPDRGLWSSMWQTPTVESTVDPGRSGLDRVPVSILKSEAVGEFVHLTSHREVQFRVYCATTRQRKGEWVSLDRVGDLPMSNAMRRVLELACGWSR